MTCNYDTKEPGGFLRLHCIQLLKCLATAESKVDNNGGETFKPGPSSKEIKSSEHGIQGARQSNCQH
jgi:hypothetical protein